MNHSDYIKYIENTGQSIVGLPIEAFDDDWEPIGSMVRRDLVAAGLISIVDDKIFLLSPTGCWTLFTKDGSKRGNAVLIKEIKPRNYTMAAKLFLVETDFGNYMKVTQAEIDEMYTKGKPIRYMDWAFDRDLARLATKEIIESYD